MGGSGRHEDVFGGIAQVVAQYRAQRIGLMISGALSRKGVRLSDAGHAASARRC